MATARQFDGLAKGAAMGVNVYLEDGRHTGLGSVPDPHRHLKRVFEAGNADLTLLKYVNVYGDTVFNRLQADDLLADIDAIRSRPVSPEADELLSRVREYVLALRREWHLYLRFAGE